MTVTKLEYVTKIRCKVFIDEKFAFVLYKGELSRYHIREREEISAETYARIRQEVIVKRAKLKVMHLLTDMEHTESQLRTKMRRGLYTEDVIEEALEYVKSFGYINDAGYARSFIERRKDKKSRKELYAALMQKGISREEAKTALEECYEESDSKEAILQLIRKKRYDCNGATEQERQKMLGFLLRKGFNYEDIRQVIQVSDWEA